MSPTYRGEYESKDWDNVTEHGRYRQHIISKQPTQVIYLKNIMIKKGISIVGLAEVKRNWSKTPIKENIFNRTNGWFKKRRIGTGYIWFTTFDRTFQSGGTATMVVDKVPCTSMK